MRCQLLRLLCVVGLAFVAGCAGEAGSTDTASSPAVALPDPSEVSLAALKSADLLDGTEDHVVSKCYTCSLGMDGKDEYTSKFGDYTVKLCSQGCCDHFNSDPESVVASTEVPAAQ